jgi:formate dehydrogenase alpha subunit
MSIRITVNGKDMTVKENKTILEVCRESGIFIPTLCYDERLDPYGGCRLCLVEIKGMARPLAACTTPVQDGMEIITESEVLTGLRKTNLSLILSNHPNDCMCCDQAGDCSLQELAYSYNMKPGGEFEGARWDLPVRNDNPFITYDPNKCILCARCTRICNNVVMAGTIDLTGRGFYAMPDTAFRKPRSLENCEFCGQCVSTCPTGALTALGSNNVDNCARV